MLLGGRGMRASLLGSQCSERGSLSGVKQRVEAWKGPGGEPGWGPAPCLARAVGGVVLQMGQRCPTSPSHVPPVGVPPPPSLGPRGASPGLPTPVLGAPPCPPLELCLASWCRLLNPPPPVPLILSTPLLCGWGRSGCLRRLNHLFFLSESKKEKFPQTSTHIPE